MALPRGGPGRREDTFEIGRALACGEILVYVDLGVGQEGLGLLDLIRAFAFQNLRECPWCDRALEAKPLSKLTPATLSASNSRAIWAMSTSVISR